MAPTIHNPKIQALSDYMSSSFWWCLHFEKSVTIHDNPFSKHVWLPFIMYTWPRDGSLLHCDVSDVARAPHNLCASSGCMRRVIDEVSLKVNLSSGSVLYPKCASRPSLLTYGQGQHVNIVLKMEISGQIKYVWHGGCMIFWSIFDFLITDFPLVVIRLKERLQYSILAHKNR